MKRLFLLMSLISLTGLFWFAGVSDACALSTQAITPEMFEPKTPLNTWIPIETGDERDTTVLYVSRIEGDIVRFKMMNITRKPADLAEWKTRVGFPLKSTISTFKADCKQNKVYGPIHTDLYNIHGKRVRSINAIVPGWLNPPTEEGGGLTARLILKACRSLKNDYDY
jgi:hypothetical protein